MITNRYKVAIILGYYNGQIYIKSQVDSILNQTHSNLELYIFDDASFEPLKIEYLQLKNSEAARVHIINRPENVGFRDNFLSGLVYLKNNDFDYYAFSDQDDIWHADKIERGILSLLNYDNNRSLLYCARTAITDKANTSVLGLSPKFEKQPSFSNALVQNIGGGNTMIINRLAHQIVTGTLDKLDVVSHDWWCYQIVSGAGGIVHYDENPCLRYRQHDDNVIGSNNGFIARLKRVIKLLNGEFYTWNTKNLNALSNNRRLLTYNNKEKLDTFMKARESTFFIRLYLFIQSGIYRQTLLGNVGLVVGLILKKV